MNLPTARDIVLIRSFVLAGLNVKIFDSIDARNGSSFISHYEALVDVFIEWPYEALSYRFGKIIVYGIFCLRFESSINASMKFCECVFCALCVKFGRLEFIGKRDGNF